jgi:hypothetical protein
MLQRFCVARRWWLVCQPSERAGQGTHSPVAPRASQVIEVIHPGLAGVSKSDLKEKLAKMYQVGAPARRHHAGSALAAARPAVCACRSSRIMLSPPVGLRLATPAAFCCMDSRLLSVAGAARALA